MLTPASTMLMVIASCKRIDDTTGGNSGVEPRVAVIYTETVEKRGYPPEKFVDVVSANAAVTELRTVMGLVAAGKLKPVIHRSFPLAEAAEAHRVVESREIFGKV